ncbi:PREDICTED: KN motif and ankyrin repeat domain-containing protein 2 [Nicrophorus vespilloides]|uniref:KN motif and ankyrin repeat domain-containing protein 2 n=1 Tax=Nicrophorus vespilloides TaxID=110193 RepID=A0ABM1N7M0_NICVS|nr:PREDICTED: KN motif and ankyrin repeat domain-containing protein 2 [Nicrophorus vespilloides]XP_017782821.1 PREDICTED: KN motif and ankyrin repeat domain-containing protein 2 [Nicrophorus vespilloides]
MSYSQLPTDNGYGWYQCTCCPYGYHIYLDFVRYCESIGQQQVEKMGSIKRRKDRRKQRQSMEVLLGLTPPLVQMEAAPMPSLRDLEKSPLEQDNALSDAVSDFERTLQRSKNKLSNNLPDVTAVSERRLPAVSSMGTSGSSMAILHPAGNGSKDFEQVESCGLSPAALQNIRTQMALSLERTKELEEMVKMVPSLQVQLTELKEENEQLVSKLRAEEDSKLNRFNSNYLFNHFARNRSHSFSNDPLGGDSKQQPPPPPPPRRDFGVMAGVITRNVGVGHQAPHTKTVSTDTQPEQYTDRWFLEKNKFLNGPESKQNIYTSKATQTIVPKEKREAHVQTTDPRPILKDFSTQTAVKVFSDIGVNATTRTLETGIQHSPATRTVAVSDDTIIDAICAKCSELGNTTSTSISLAALSVPRSKSFHLGEAKLSRSRTIGCQYDQGLCINSSNKSTQSEIKTASKQSQHECTQSNKGSQYESSSHSKCTDTKGLIEMKHKSVDNQAETVEVACNTISEEAAKKEESVTPSRIPRPQIPTTPVENRKFKRQDTYTKIPAVPDKSPVGLSALELVPTKTIASDVTIFSEKVSPKYQQAESSAKNDELEDKNQPSVSENSLCQPPSLRKKSSPSREMQAALKVLNDSIQKKGKDTRGHLKNAFAIIQTEWFKVSSIVDADPADVEDYLDCFEDISSALLEYIVNMVDASGNTAMHYAVSHGNFDVVSILLDSKVCDIDKQNTAGYTSVMLVSLAEVRSKTHATVVRKLFSLADVNIRATQHGQTALMLAVSHGRVDMVSLLLDAGADINIRDDDGSTALMCAAEHGHIDIVKLFLSHPDCDSSIADVDGSSALKIAMEAGHRNIGILLYAHERNIHGGAPLRPKKSKSASPKTPSSPLLQHSGNRSLPITKTNY